MFEPTCVHVAEVQACPCNASEPPPLTTCLPPESASLEASSLGRGRLVLSQPLLPGMTGGRSQQQRGGGGGEGGGEGGEVPAELMAQIQLTLQLSAATHVT